MSHARKRKQEFDAGFEVSKRLSVARQELVDIAKKISRLQDLMGIDSPASLSVHGEGDTSLLETEGEFEAQRRPKEVKLMGKFLQGFVEALKDKWLAEQKNQLESESLSVNVDSHVAPSSSTQPPPVPIFPPRPKDGTPQKIRNWRKECKQIQEEYEALLGSDSDKSYPTLRALEDQGTTNAVQDWKSKQAVLAAARSIVSVTPVLADGKTGLPCSGFILHRYEHAGVIFSVIVTCSAVVCTAGRKLNPPPKLYVGLPDKETVLQAHLFCFNDHFDIALLLLPFDLSLDIPCLGCCPDYNQEVFVLGRDKDASLRVEHGVISWTEESNYMGRDYYMFLDGEVPEGGTGGPVIDHDGVFRGMAFKLSPMPAVLSISTIMSCSAMFMHFGRVAWPKPGWNLRAVASVDVDILESLSVHNIKNGYIVEEVHDGTPAEISGICRGDVIVSINGHKELTSLPELEDYLLLLGWKYLIGSVTTTNLEIVKLLIVSHPVESVVGRSDFAD
ncbi:hypothetical protein EJB05_40019 [Eragrostis curvula]|uniref:PDZ domain-containing protein n=1 Tax=Eragrostis curvula TaxID=38414 RepID=A0A5J9TYJ0_9POAL|nr:hypothetical protein EJB05_40019 [Eragrostis curvula]